jgi:hypothetical protein
MSDHPDIEKLPLEIVGIPVRETLCAAIQCLDRYVNSFLAMKVFRHRERCAFFFGSLHDAVLGFTLIFYFRR